MNNPALKVIQDANEWLLTMEEAADVLGVSRRALEGLISRGRLAKLHLKGRPFIAANDVQTYRYFKKGLKRMLVLNENPYAGINPHWMSFLQTPGGGLDTSDYPSFHNDHITHIKDFLNRYLPPEYVAVSEKSLQIRSKFSEDEPSIHSPRPDVTILEQSAPTSPAASTATASAPSMHLTISLEDQTEMRGISIYTIEVARQGIRGIPVTRIELLSPSNMPGGRYDNVYQINRNQCILAETPLVEIDYLHEYPSPVYGLPRYPKDENTKAYNIAVTNPYTDDVAVYFFGLDNPMPTVLIPLGKTNKMAFDFGEPYRYTWETSRMWGYIDYSQAPMRMQRYRDSDQMLIQHKMKEIQEKAKRS